MPVLISTELKALSTAMWRSLSVQCSPLLLPCAVNSGRFCLCTTQQQHLKSRILLDSPLYTLVL